MLVSRHARRMTLAPRRRFSSGYDHPPDWNNVRKKLPISRISRFDTFRHFGADTFTPKVPTEIEPSTTNAGAVISALNDAQSVLGYSLHG